MEFVLGPCVSGHQVEITFYQLPYMTSHCSVLSYDASHYHVGRVLNSIVFNSVVLFPTWHGDLCLVFQINDGAFSVSRTRYVSDFLLVKPFINCFIDYDEGDIFVQRFLITHEC